MAGREILERPAPPADRRIAYGERPQQFIDFRIPAGPGPFPLVVHIHGGFWRNRFDLLHAGHVCAALTAAGVLTANIEYRRVGDEGGGWPGTCEDVETALRFAREQARPFGHNGRTVVTGHSAGGHLALWLATRVPDLTGVVALAPVAHLRKAQELRLGNGAVEEFLGGSPAEFPDRYAAACPSVHRSAVHRIVMHGRKDDIVPYEVSRAYAKARDGEPVHVIELVDSDHFEVIDPQTLTWDEVMDAVTGPELRLCGHA